MRIEEKTENLGEKQSKSSSSQLLASSPRLRLAVSPRRAAVPSAYCLVPSGAMPHASFQRTTDHGHHEVVDES